MTETMLWFVYLATVTNANFLEFSKANQIQLASYSSTGFIHTTKVDIAHPPAVDSNRLVTVHACRTWLFEN
jgi:hypothetical protein